MKVPVENIIVKNRIRKELGNIESLSNSIKKHGLLNNIIINEDYELIAGHRRLEAVKKLGWSTVSVSFINNLSKIEKLELEIQENLYRKDFTNNEIEEAYTRLNKLKNPSFFQKILAFLIKIYKLIFKQKKA